MTINSDPGKFVKVFHQVVGRGDVFAGTGCFKDCPFDSDLDAIQYIRLRAEAIHLFAERTKAGARTPLRWYEYLLMSTQIVKAMRGCYAAKELAMTEWIVDPSTVPRAPQKQGISFYANYVRETINLPTALDLEVNMCAIQLYRLYHTLHRHPGYFEAWKRSKINEQKQGWEHQNTDERLYDYTLHKAPVDKIW